MIEVNTSRNILFYDAQQRNVIKDLGFPDETYTDWLAEALNVKTKDITTVDVINNELPSLTSINPNTTTIFIAGAHSSVNDGHPWQEKLEKETKEAIEAGILVIGLCYGMQTLVKTYGGEVIQDSQGELGLTTVDLTEEGKAHPVFRDIPESFPVFTAHSEEVNPTTMKHMQLLAVNRRDHIQAVSGKNFIGTQFHPELTYREMERIMGKQQSSFLSENISAEYQIVDFEKIKQAEEIGKKILHNAIRWERNSTD
jgi:GMP synthase (glutamine-hydrolysing)